MPKTRTTNQQGICSALEFQTNSLDEFYCKGYIWQLTCSFGGVLVVVVYLEGTALKTKFRSTYIYFLTNTKHAIA